MQDVLFGAGWDGPDEADDAHETLTISTLNVQGGPPARVLPVMDWVTRTRSDVLVLSEVREQNAPVITRELRALDYDVELPGTDLTGRTVLLAARSYLEMTAGPTMERAGVISMNVRQRPFSVIGVYAPTNGMSAESSATRSDWQRRFVLFLRELDGTRPRLLTGDFNVLEPGHVPSSPFYEEHDYRFYGHLIESGYTDCYRRSKPSGTDHSWSSPRFGSQRLDHTFITSAHARSLRSCDYDSAPVEDGLSDHRAMTTQLDAEF